MEPTMSQSFNEAMDGIKACLDAANQHILELQKYQTDPGWVMAENREMKIKLRKMRAAGQDVYALALEHCRNNGWGSHPAVDAWVEIINP